MKDVEDCEKLWGAVKQAMIRRYPNGATQPKGYRERSERGELKHLSTHRKRNQKRFPQ